MSTTLRLAMLFFWLGLVHLSWGLMAAYECWGLPEEQVPGRVLVYLLLTPLILCLAASAGCVMFAVADDWRKE